MAWRSQATTGEAGLFDHLSLADAAAITMELERMGFDVDPQPTIDRIRPALLKKKMLTRAELRVLWYPKERHRCSPLQLVGDRGIDPKEDCFLPERWEITTALGINPRASQ
jgi:hypothetical protein